MEQPGSVVTGKKQFFLYYKTLKSIRLVLSVLSVWCLSSDSVQAEDWPQFRGPNCSGVSHSKHSLPAKFSQTENVKWSADLGDGIGCPVVASGRVFTSGMKDDKTVVLSAFDTQSGDLLWERSWPTGELLEIHKTNSFASTTPAADDKHCYFYFSTLGMVCVDAKTGKDVWQKKLPIPYFVFKWGAGMSPTLYKNMVLFCQDDDLAPAFYAFDKANGDILWKDDRTDQAVNYSHPVICETEKGDEIILAGTGRLIGYDPATGKRLWTANTLLRNIKTTPVSFNGTIYVSLQSGGIANQWLASIDRWETGNSDGKVSKDEIQAFVGKFPVPEAFYKKTFDRGDINKDGFLEGEELDIAFLPVGVKAGAKHDEQPAQEFIMAVKGGGRGDVTESHLLWKHPTKYTDHIVSPLVSDGRILLIKGGGISTCYEIDKGEQLWGPKRIQNTCEYFASPVTGDGKTYIAGENGFIVVLENGPKQKILSKNDMGDSILGSPAIADGSLFVRTRSQLLCISK